MNTAINISTININITAQGVALLLLVIFVAVPLITVYFRKRTH